MCGYNRELLPGIGSCDFVTSENSWFRYPFEVSLTVHSLTQIRPIIKALLPFLVEYVLPFQLTMLITFILPLLFIIYCYVRILGTLNEMATQTTVHLPVQNVNSDSSQVNMKKFQEVEEGRGTIRQLGANFPA